MSLAAKSVGEAQWGFVWSEAPCLRIASGIANASNEKKDSDREPQLTCCSFRLGQAKLSADSHDASVVLEIQLCCQSLPMGLSLAKPSSRVCLTKLQLIAFHIWKWTCLCQRLPLTDRFHLDADHQ